MREQVEHYYGEVLQGSDDLQTDACCDQPPPGWLKPLIAQLHDEVVSRYYGCGLTVPLCLDGARVLDLGCGSGRDAFLLSALVGEQGEVVGVDMTAAQLQIAERHRDYHRQRFGHAQSNVRFLQGYMEELDALGLPDNHFDVVVSNCVLNLSPDKERVLREVYRVLKPGGEMYFADVYGDRRVPEALRSDPVLYGECLSGALYWNDFLTLARRAGFTDPRLVAHRPIGIGNPELAERVAPARFHSATCRLFKLDALEPDCEDYGQAVVYRGSAAHAPKVFELDAHHRIEAGRVFPVCGNTWRMLADTRFAPHFEFIGSFETHYGLFEGCGSGLPFALPEGAPGDDAACC